MPQKIAAVAYYRMSSDKQETSIRDQKSAVEEYANQNGYKIIREYADEGVSGWKAEQRQAFQELIYDAQKRGDFKAVLCWDQDRFSRFDPMEANHYWYLLDRAGVHLATVTQGKLDWHDLGGWLTASVQQHGKAQYVKDLARNTTRGLRKRKLAGQWVGTAPYGYNLQDGQLVPGDPEKIEVVRRIFNERVQGYGLTTIAKNLNSDGITTPRGAGWSTQSVKHILQRDAYIGNTVIGKHARGKFERISEEQVTIENTHPRHHRPQDVGPGPSHATPKTSFYKSVGRRPPGRSADVWQVWNQDVLPQTARLQLLHLWRLHAWVHVRMLPVNPRMRRTGRVSQD